MVDIETDRYYLQEREYESLMEFITEYDDLSLHQHLANKLAWRDFQSAHSEKEIEEIRKNNGGYFGVDIHPFEEKYWNEFEAHEYSRLKIQDE
jgi:hypothetical protein